ncbi:hypothetical protein IAU60_004571 [Kwoniella sp. DSM 27419]
MSKRSDLLVRVRYLNPVPNPPFPPKLVNVATDISRLGEPSYLDHLAASTPLPMLVDSEMGMPLDLNAYDGVWDGKDQSDVGGDQKPMTATEVSWMRNNNYLTRKNNARRKEAAEAKAETVVDASEAAQIMAIEKTFVDLYEQDPLSITHPDKRKRGLTSYDVLPDIDSWSNSYALIRFPERPSAATSENPAAGATSPRLARSVLRPIVEDDDQQMIEFYLPKEEDVDHLNEAYDRAVPSGEVEHIIEVSGEDPNDPALSDIFPRRDEIATQADLWDKAVVGYRHISDVEDQARMAIGERVSQPNWASGELRRLRGGGNTTVGQGEAIDDEDIGLDEGARRIEAEVNDSDDVDDA